jgi:hypothetical protein
MSANTTLAAIELLTALLTHAANLSLILQKAQAEGRDLNADEWAGIIGANDAAIGRLLAEIENARTKGE